MPTISDFAYGYDSAGVEDYLEAIKTEALQKAKEAVENIEDIKKVCENEWEGQSRDNFLTNLQEDANHVGDQFSALYEVLESEINSLNAAMANKDEKLISTK